MASDNAIFSPSWGRGLFAFGIAFVAFCLPQEVPLEWYPLNEPGDDINYLEISCTSDATGQVQIFYDTGKGWNDLNSIRFPISATAQTYTYTFPLLDAPITALRLTPGAAGSTLTIRQMRIIDRRGTEMRRFTGEMFKPFSQIALIAPLPDGWKIISETNATAPTVDLPLNAPIVAKGINHRNFLRCLYSSSYLALMLWILLLAVLFTFYQPRSWRDAVNHLGFMATLAVLFSLVGNRGLIKNSVRYSQFVAPAVKPGVRLEFDLRTSQPAIAQLFWDSGKGFNENESVYSGAVAHTGLQTLAFPLPAGPFKALRFDPIDGHAQLAIRGIRIVDEGHRTLLSLPLSTLMAQRDIESCAVQNELLEIKTSSTGNDPILTFTPSAVSQINSALTHQR